MRFELLLMLLALAACTPSLTGANERGGMISYVNGYNRADSFALADEHCRKFGRAAKVSETNALNSTIAFDCVN